MASSPGRSASVLSANGEIRSCHRASYIQDFGNENPVTPDVESAPASGAVGGVDLGLGQQRRLAGHRGVSRSGIELIVTDNRGGGGT